MTALILRHGRGDSKTRSSPDVVLRWLCYCLYVLFLRHFLLSVPVVLVLLYFGYIWYVHLRKSHCLLGEDIFRARMVEFQLLSCIFIQLFLEAKLRTWKPPWESKWFNLKLFNWGPVYLKVFVKVREGKKNPSGCALIRGPQLHKGRRGP